MNTYALVQDGAVTNTVVWDGGDDWAPPEGVSAVAVPDDMAVGIGYSYDGTTFTAPPAPPIPPLDAAQVLASNTATQTQLLSDAAVAIAPLQLAVSLGEATDAETASAKEWVAYSRAVKAVDLTSATPAWPTPPSA